MDQKPRQQQAGQPDEAYVKHRNPEIGKIVLPQPHKANSEQQSVRAMQPPKLVFVDTSPCRQRAPLSVNALFRSQVGIRHPGTAVKYRNTNLAQIGRPRFQLSKRAGRCRQSGDYIQDKFNLNRLSSMRSALPWGVEPRADQVDQRGQSVAKLCRPCSLT